MPDPQTAKTSDLLRQLPSVDDLLQTGVALEINQAVGRNRALAIARAACDDVRNKVLNGENEAGSVEDVMRRIWQRERRSGVRRVINATGVIIHTNLGRAPLSEDAKRALIERASGYCTLEYDIETGKRGKRGLRAERLVCEITGAENAVIVNNCAAAAFLVLTVFAAGKEVVISRGELVEIGGDFRVPDVLTQSGAVLREIGTTNRTKLRDYEQAISENTGLILRVHPSNYRIIGFTETPAIEDIAALAHRNNILLYEDAGSGALADLFEYGLGDEPLIKHSINAGADIVSLSGDKLLGGTQAGIIVGRDELIEKLRKHPLYRALRVDKLAYAVIEATLESYVRETHFEDIPVLRMLSADIDELEKRTRTFAAALEKGADQSLKVEVIKGVSVIGGGSAPDVKPPTWLISIAKSSSSADEIEGRLRDADPPVIARIADDKVVLDLRTVFENEEQELVKAVLSLCS